MATGHAERALLHGLGNQGAHAFEFRGGGRAGLFAANGGPDLARSHVAADIR
jgi:hypothetical protein